MNVYQKYGMSFIIGNGSFGRVPEALFLDKSIERYLGCLIFDLNKPIIAKHIIEEIESIFSGLSKGYWSGTYTHTYVIGLESTDLYYDFTDAPEYLDGVLLPNLTIPTVDFRDIFVEWKKFLEDSTQYDSEPLTETNPLRNANCSG